MGLTHGKLSEYESDYKNRVKINELTIPKPSTDLEISIMMARHTYNTDKLLGTFEQNNIMEASINLECENIQNQITENTIGISIMTDFQKIFDKLILIYVDQSEEELIDTDYLVKISNIAKYCGQVKNTYYFKSVYELVLKNMDTTILSDIYRDTLLLAAHKGNIEILEYIDSDSINILTYNMLLFIAYGAISGNQMDVLKWVFSHKLKLHTYDCLLNACVYLNRVDMFRELYKPGDDNRYCVDSMAMDLVLMDKHTDMFLEIIKNNCSRKDEDEGVMDYCMELDMRSKMVDLIVLDESENVNPEPRHVKYIAQDVNELERLVNNYKSDVFVNILCYALNDQNIDKILEIAKTCVKKSKNRDNLNSSDLVLIVGSTNDEKVILRVLENFTYTSDEYGPENLIDGMIVTGTDHLTPHDAIAHAIGNDSNTILLKILIDKFNVKLTKDMVSQILWCYCNTETLIAVLQNADEYEPSKVVDSLICRSTSKNNQLNICEIELILDTVLTKYPVFELDDCNLMCFDKIMDTNLIDMFVSKLRLTHKHLIGVIKYKTSDICFYHICRTYLKNQPLEIRLSIANELSYSLDDMMKNNLQRLIFLVEELDVPLEFQVLEKFGKTYEQNKYVSMVKVFCRYFDKHHDIDIENLKKNNVSYEQLDKFIRLCTDRALLTLKNRFDNSQYVV